MKNTFYCVLKAFLVLEIFRFLFCLFGYLEKQLDKKAKIDFKFYDVTDWTTNHSGFIQSGKSGKKVPFTQGVMESQGI